jgi:predicted HTH transcriptional regulator
MQAIIDKWGNLDKQFDAYIFDFLKGNETPRQIKTRVRDVISNLKTTENYLASFEREERDWNPAAIYRTICAFANDFENIGGGYIIIGAEEEKGRAKRPVSGITIEELDSIQKRN